MLRAGRQVDAKRVVVYHHQAAERVPECRDRCTVPRQGETISIP